MQDVVPYSVHVLTFIQCILTGKEIPMATNGTVKFFNQSRGFGFVTPEDGSKDVFIHVTALEAAGIPSIDEGDKITFDIEDDQRGRGKQATNVQLAQ